mgnify:FL=1
MTDASTIDRRRKFSRLDNEKAGLLRDSKATIERVLPGVLDEFYAHIEQFQETRSMF